MDMAEQILVVFLSAALAIFLVLGIVLLSVCIKIAKHIRNISAKAEMITDRAESVAEFVSSAATPMAIAKIVSAVTDTIFRRKEQPKK